MKTLLIDNYDSFTFNLYQLLAQVNGVAPTVVHNDAPLAPGFTAEHDNVVVSPGPGRPERRRDVGVSLAAIREATVPVLGVCLGHQGIGHVHGARVVHAPEAMHGRVSAVHHDGRGLFAGLPSPLAAVRYHSLCVVDLPDELEMLARSDDGVVMALRHRELPLWGVQFHPESIGTQCGRALLANFRRLTERHHRAALPARSRPPPPPAPPSSVEPFTLHTREVTTAADPEAIFLELYGDSPTAFWLDSAAVIPGLSRYSYLGDAAGPHAEQVTYDVAARRVTVTAGGVPTVHHEPILDHLDRRLRARRLHHAGAPFPFTLGYVGYLGYEVKADCGGDRAHDAPTPDASFVFADRMVVVDHAEQRVWLAALSRPSTADQAQAWLAATAARLAALPPLAPGLPETDGSEDAPPLTFRHDDDAYQGLVEACQRLIRDGESYEVCLTNTVSAGVVVDPVAAYRVARRVNPAPYGALLRWPGLA
ncbi:MAG: glutamine amidotransferase-related protein, partial [Egibacteraceae bacterium]